MKKPCRLLYRLFGLKKDVRRGIDIGGGGVPLIYSIFIRHQHLLINVISAAGFGFPALLNWTKTSLSSLLRGTQSD